MCLTLMCGTDVFTCSVIIDVSFIDKNLVKDDGSSFVHGNSQSSREGQFVCMSVDARHA